MAKSINMDKRPIVIFSLCLFTMLCSAIVSVYAMPQKQILALNSWYPICSNTNGNVLAMFVPDVSSMQVLHKGEDRNLVPIGCSWRLWAFETGETPAVQMSGYNTGAVLQFDIRTIISQLNTVKFYVNIVYKVRDQNETSQSFSLDANSEWNTTRIQLSYNNIEYVKVFFMSYNNPAVYYDLDNIAISEFSTSTNTPTTYYTPTITPTMTATPTPSCINVEYKFESDNENFTSSIQSSSGYYPSKIFSNGGVYLSEHHSSFPFNGSQWYGAEIDNGLILYPGSYNYEQYGFAIPSENPNGYFRTWLKEDAPGQPTYWELLWSRQTNNYNPPAIGSFSVGYTGTLYIEFTDYDCAESCGRNEQSPLLRAGRLDNLRIWQNGCSGTPTPTGTATNTATPTPTATPDQQCTTYDYSLSDYSDKGKIVYGDWFKGIGIQSVNSCASSNGKECIRTFVNPIPYKDITNVSFIFTNHTTKTMQLQSTNISLISSTVSNAYTNTFELNSQDDGYFISHITALDPISILRKEIICGRGTPTTPTPTQPPTAVLPPTLTGTPTPTLNKPPTATYFPTPPATATRTPTPIGTPNLVTPMPTPTIAPINTDFYYSLQKSTTTCYWLLPSSDYIGFAGISVCFDWYELRLVAFGVEVPVYWLFAVISILLVFRIFIKST